MKNSVCYIWQSHSFSQHNKLFLWAKKLYYRLIEGYSQISIDNLQNLEDNNSLFEFLMNNHFVGYKPLKLLQSVFIPDA